MRHLNLTIFLFLTQLAHSQVFVPFGYWQDTQSCPYSTKIFDTNGTHTFWLPIKCGYISIYAWGAGAGGGEGNGTNDGGNGGAGGHTALLNYPVSGGQIVTVVVPSGGSGGDSTCVSPGVGGGGQSSGGVASLATVGTNGGGLVLGGAGGNGADGGQSAGNGYYGGGGGGSSSLGLGGGGGGSASVAIGSSTIVIVGGGGGGGGRNGSGGAAGNGAPGCAQTGENATSGGGQQKAGAGGGGSCFAGVPQNGTGRNPYSIASPAVMPGANATGGLGSSSGIASCNRGTDGYIYISQSSTPSGGPIALDSTTTAPGDDAASISWAHTINAGPNRILIVGIAYQNSIPVSGVTYSGVAMTEVGSISNGSNATAAIYRLVGPPIGTANVVVTFGVAVKFIAGSASFFNVDQANPIGTFVSATGLTATPAVNHAGVVATDWIIDSLAIKGNQTATPGAGQTARWNAALNADIRSAGSTKSGVSGAVPMSWTLSGSIEWALGSATLKQAP